MTDHRLGHPPRRHLTFRLLAIVIGIAGIALLVRHFGDLQRFLALAQQAEPLWILLAVAVQVGTYVAVALG
jgi:hypothetical protein